MLLLFSIYFLSGKVKFGLLELYHDGVTNQNLHTKISTTTQFKGKQSQGDGSSVPEA